MMYSAVKEARLQAHRATRKDIRTSESVIIISSGSLEHSLCTPPVVCLVYALCMSGVCLVYCIPDEYLVYAWCVTVVCQVFLVYARYGLLYA